MELVEVTVRVLPSATKVTFFGVVTARVRPPRPSGCEREADSVAPSARMPRSCSAESTSVAVVQYSLVCPSTVTVSLRPYRTEMWSPSLTEEASEGTTTSCGPTAMSCLSRTSATVEPRTWTELGCPSTETSTALS